MFILWSICVIRHSILDPEHALSMFILWSIWVIRHSILDPEHTLSLSIWILWSLWVIRHSILDPADTLSMCILWSPWVIRHSILDPEPTWVHCQRTRPDHGQRQGRDAYILRPREEDLEELEVRKDGLAAGQQQPRRGRVRNGSGPEASKDNER